MGRFAVLAPGFEHLSYPLGRHDACEGNSFAERSEQFSFSPAQSEEHAQMALLYSEGLSEHASEPVGYVRADEGGIFLVCRSSGKQRGELAHDERIAFCLAVVRRLAALHTDGLGCGGLSPDAVEFSGREAKLSHPLRMFALAEGDSAYYEAVATLRALVSSGMASKGSLPALASAYLSHSPVCRHEIRAHLVKKGVRAAPAAALAEAAIRFAPYF